MAPITVDLHAHAIVPDALLEMQKAQPDHGPVLIEADGRRWLKYPQRERLGPLPEGIFEPSLRIADMDRQRVDRQIIAIPPPNFHYHVPAEVGVDFARIQNDGIRSLSESNPDRFHMFGTLPLQDIEASVVELKRIAAYPLMRGIQFGTNINGVDLDDPSFAPVFAEMEALNLPVWLHPDQRSIAGIDRITKYYLQNFIGNPLEIHHRDGSDHLRRCHGTPPHTAVSVSSTVAVSRHTRPDAGTMVGATDRAQGVHQENSSPANTSRRFFIDSLTHDALSLELLGRRIGWEQVVLGSDYPFDMMNDDPVSGVEAVGILTDEEREAVLSTNADRFLRPCPAHSH